VIASEVESRSYAQQGELLPAFAENALGPTAPLSVADDVVEELDLGSFERRYAVRGARL
jgi:hypothetical protein